MRNYIQPGKSLTVEAPSDVESGDGVLVGKLFGVAANDADSGEEVVIHTEGVFELPKESAGSGQDWSAGDALYWDDSEDRLTTTASGNIQVAFAAADADSEAEYGHALLGVKGEEPS